MRFPLNLEVWKLGTVNYLEELKLQEKLFSDRKAHKIPDVLVSLQLPPTYTLGKWQTDHNLLIPVMNLKRYHGKQRKGLNRSAHRLHSNPKTPRPYFLDPLLKIGANGASISSGITSHGLAFNTDPGLDYFQHIVPCGIADKEVTSLRRETGTVLPSEDVIHEQLISCFARIFGFKNLILKENKSILLDNGKSERHVD
ncbi:LIPOYLTRANSFERASE 2 MITOCHONDRIAL-RELATED [Salix purpurea]|uniref:lipoyl(octanoyl) transferase n=1 Tax=Salix purpurea TaxID=77065 RepID=A0A9Q0T8L8_SALPP|nr:LIPOYLTRANSFERASE 2 MITOCHONDRIAL-RELATED [Salix purpurea]